MMLNGSSAASVIQTPSAKKGLAAPINPPEKSCSGLSECRKDPVEGSDIVSNDFVHNKNLKKLEFDVKQVKCGGFFRSRI